MGFSSNCQVNDLPILLLPSPIIVRIKKIGTEGYCSLLNDLQIQKFPGHTNQIKMNTKL